MQWSLNFCTFQVCNNFFLVLKKLLQDTRVNLLVVYSNKIYVHHSSYARPLKICEVCNFGAITGSLCERFVFKTDLWFRLIWNCSCGKALQFLLVLKSKVRRLHRGGFQTLTEPITLIFAVVCVTFRGLFCALCNCFVPECDDFLLFFVTRSYRK